MPEHEIDLKVLKAAVNAVLDHLIEDLGVDKLTIPEESDYYRESTDMQALAEDLSTGRLSDDFDFVKLIRRGQSFDVSYNLVHVAPVLRFIGETVKK